VSDKTVTPDGVRVEVGQVWIDLDKRMGRRRITIVRVDAYNGLAYYSGYRRIRIDRLRKPFWENASGR
jgi:hypothetical protein